VTQALHLSVGKLPIDWKAARFAELVAFHMGKTPPRRIKKYWQQGEYPWVSISDMRPFAVVSETAERVSRAAHNEVFHGKLVPAGHTLMSFKLTIGRVATLGIPAYHNEAIISFRPNGTVNEDYLRYYLAQIDYARYQDKAIKGHTLNKSKLARLEIALPPPGEQKAIAAVLSTVQRAIDHQERLIGLLTELKKALMHKLFTEGTRGEPQKQTEIGPVPQSWEVIALGSLGKIGNGSTPKRDKAGYWRDGTIPWLTSAKIHDCIIQGADEFVTDLATRECHLPNVKANSLLIAITGQGKTLGNCALVTFQTCISQHLAYVQFTSNRVNPRFMLWFLQSRYEDLRAISQGGGSTKGALTCGFLKSYPVPVPGIDEQLEIEIIFESLLEKMAVHKGKLAALQDLFRTLLHQLMTAQIRVHDIDLSELALSCVKAELEVG
jgi:type I restriction enzyme S subunit